jgi:hypothetical protein
MIDGTYERLRARLLIDQLSLDQELIDIGELIATAADGVAEAAYKRDTIANQLKLVEAQVADTLRKEQIVDGKGASKTRSEAQIDKETPLDAEYQETLVLRTEADFELAKWSALVNGLRAKQSSIKTIGEMTIAGFLTSDAVYNQERHNRRRSS